MEFIFILFFIVIAILRAVGWFLEVVQGQQRPRQAPGRPAGRQGESPLESMLRMLQEQAEAQQREAEQTRARQAARRQAPRARPVARPAGRRAPTVPLIPQESDPGREELRDRHLRGGVSERHLVSEVGEGLSRRQLKTQQRRLQGRLRASELVTEQRQSTLEQLEALPPLARAIVFSEVLGPPRALRPYRAR